MVLALAWDMDTYQTGIIQPECNKFSVEVKYDMRSVFFISMQVFKLPCFDNDCYKKLGETECKVKMSAPCSPSMT